MRDFYLGVSNPDWLRRAAVPLFVSHTRLTRYRRLPRAAAPWCLDSGGFSELHLLGRWMLDQRVYVRNIARFHSEIGKLRWCAPMDWMCEASCLTKTGLTIPDHQRLTLDNLIDLRSRTDHWIIPVLQGWTLADYLRHADQYEQRGIDLAAERVVGVGSICRRQGTAEAADIIRALKRRGIRVHAFGMKQGGLLEVHRHVESADSMAWSARARWHGKPMFSECGHSRCTDCLKWALAWREDLIDQTGSASDRIAALIRKAKRR